MPSRKCSSHLEPPWLALDTNAASCAFEQVSAGLRIYIPEGFQAVRAHSVTRRRVAQEQRPAFAAAGRVLGPARQNLRHRRRAAMERVGFCLLQRKVFRSAGQGGPLLDTSLCADVCQVLALTHAWMRLLQTILICDALNLEAQLAIESDGPHVRAFCYRYPE